MTKTEEFLNLLQENPTLPIIPMVNSEVIADDSYTYWKGEWEYARITEVYEGREAIHFRDDDEEEVLTDMEGCDYAETKDGRDIYELSDEEWKALYDSLNWIKAIVVYIGV